MSKVNAELVFGHGLKMTIADDGKQNVLVDTANSIAGDQTLPISGLGVQSIVDDVETILQSI